MPRLPGINHLDAIRALQKVGFRVVRQTKHIIMSNGTQTLIIPRHNNEPVCNDAIFREFGKEWINPERRHQ
jgi:predicted RNA binding protein YcfA (HicA-like mRNA interferase family)